MIEQCSDNANLWNSTSLQVPEVYDYVLLVTKDGWRCGGYVSAIADDGSAFLIEDWVFETADLVSIQVWGD